MISNTWFLKHGRSRDLTLDKVYPWVSSVLIDMLSICMEHEVCISYTICSCIDQQLNLHGSHLLCLRHAIYNIIMKLTPHHVLIKSTISSVWYSNGTRPSPKSPPRLQDKIWEWPGNEASNIQHNISYSLCWACWVYFQNQSYWNSFLFLLFLCHFFLPSFPSSYHLSCLLLYTLPSLPSSSSNWKSGSVNWQQEL